jgi:hypothetical protein
MKQEHADQQKPFNPADYPALQDFFPAYLHEDFVEEYGSAMDAVKGFLADASGDEILQVKEEWKAFRVAFRGRPFPEIQAAIGKLGSAWRPAEEAELKDCDEIFSRAET